MITLKEFMEVNDYKVTEGNDYLWDSFGRNAYMLSYWNGSHDGFNMSILFDTETQVVYKVEVCDYKNERAYRLINPEYKQGYMDEAKRKNVKHDEAWDNVNYVDLETSEDWIVKAVAIKEGKVYDTRVQLPIELSDEEFATIARMAHDRDITFNQMVEQILMQFIESQKE